MSIPFDPKYPPRNKVNGLSSYMQGAKKKDPNVTWCKKHPTTFYNFKKYDKCFKCYQEQKGVKIYMNKKASDMTKEDEEAIDSIVKGAEGAETVHEPAEAALAVQDDKDTAIATIGHGIAIQGLEGVPASILPIPFVKLVQGTSKKIELEDGKDAPVGSFYFTDLQKDFEREVNGVMTMVPTKQLLLLGIALDRQKLFILTLSVMSFSNFGRLISKFKDVKVSATWEYEIKATAEKMENKKGKFQIANFQIGRKLTEEEIGQMAQTYAEYGGVLEREDIQQEVNATE